jgi:hypothetical protein
LPQSWNKRQFQQLLLAVNQHALVRGLPEPALVADKAGFVCCGTYRRIMSAVERAAREA